MIRLHERSKIGIKGGKSLCAGPFVLHNAEEIHHLVAQHGKMLCGSRSDLAGNASKSLLNELL